MQKIPMKVLVGIAVVLSLVTAGLVYSYLKSQSAETTKKGEPVVVATVDIPGRTVITKEMVKVVMVPPELVQPGAVNDLGKVVGVMSRVPMTLGDQVTDRRLAVDGKVPGFVGQIPSDKRAFTIAANDISGVSGFVKAGDYIDLIMTVGGKDVGVSKMVLQNILVLAYNRNDNMDAATKDKAAASEKTGSVTLAVTPREATMLALASETSRIYLALRPFQPTPSYALLNTISTDDIIYRPYVPKETASTATPTPAYTPAYIPPAYSPPAYPVERVHSSSGVTVIRGTKVSSN
ncbi:MAG: Flp pilus assembly protein CpaB [Firmicutes bacterium]|nr:Flp pilus assembly protein CpaB [Bacillota bacterium]